MPSRDGSPMMLTPGVSVLTSFWPRCSSSCASSESWFSISSDSPTLSCIRGTLPVSIRDMESISWIRFSIRPVTCSERSRYLSRSRYTPTPSSMPVSWPLRMVTGVFSSCEAAEKNAMRWRSSSRSCSTSPRRAWFASSRSDRAVDSRLDMQFRLRPRAPISSLRCSGHSQLKSSSDIRPAIPLSRTMGRVI